MTNKMYLYLVSVSIILGVSAIAKNAIYYAPEDTASYFEEFIITYGKHYANEQERAKRFEIFKDNLEEANRLNRDSHHAVFGITDFMDLTKEEFKKMFTGLGEPRDDIYCNIKNDGDIPNSGAPDSLDYRTMGYVTAVKDQKSCGSCYAFSAIGQIEGQYAKVHGSLQEFSEQQIVDCDQVSSGCQRGYASAALKALIKMGGSMTETQYPYEGQQNKCRVDSNKIVAKVVDCVSYQLTSQETLKQLLHQVGPISIAVKSAVLHTHTVGIISDRDCTGDVDHAVLLVGYGTENGVDYWIVKNSWGPNKLEKGYFRVERNASSGSQGPCGILSPAMTTATVS